MVPAAVVDTFWPRPKSIAVPVVSMRTEPRANLLVFFDRATGDVDVLGGNRRLPKRVSPIWPASLCLQRKIELPASAERQLEQILANELARTTPMPASDVCWSYFKTGTSDEGKMGVTQLVARKNEIAGVVDDLRSKGVVVDGVWIEGGEPDRAVPGYSQPVPFTFRLWRGLNVGLVGFAAATIAAALYIPYTANVEAERANRAVIAELTIEATGLRKTIGALEQDASNEQELRHLLSQRYHFIKSLEQLTSVTPDDVWLTEIVYHDVGVTLRGFAANSAADYVLTLSGLNSIEDARFAGPVSRAPGQNGERFEIAAEYVRAGVQ